MGGRGSGKPRSKVAPKYYKAGYLDRANGQAYPVRWLRECAAGIVADLGGAPSVLQAELAARASFAMWWLRDLERKAMAGEPIAWEDYHRHHERLTRCASLLGISRHARSLDLEAALAESVVPAVEESSGA